MADDQREHVTASGAPEDEHEEHVTTTEARAGSTPHMTRYVLVFGTGLVIILFAIILFIAA